jgi:hypothetical protein
MICAVLDNAEPLINKVHRARCISCVSVFDCCRSNNMLKAFATLLVGVARY